jgi:hypothetical protein
MVFLLVSCPKLRSMGLCCGCRTAAAFHHWGTVRGFQWWMKWEVYAQLGQGISLQNICRSSGMKDSGQSRDVIVVTCIDSLLSPGMSGALAGWTRAHAVTYSPVWESVWEEWLCGVHSRMLWLTGVESPRCKFQLLGFGQMGEPPLCAVMGIRVSRISSPLNYLAFQNLYFLVEC